MKRSTSRRAIALVTVLVLSACGAVFAHGSGDRFVDVAATLFGHPAHPIFVVFPLALFPVALLFDAIYLWRRQEFWWRASFWMLGLGLLGALVAAGLGFSDYFIALPQKGDVHEVAETHWHWIVLGVTVFAINFAPRLPYRRRELPTWLAGLGLALSLLGVAFVWTGGYYGGHLVFEERVGVVRPEAEHDH